jgi:hypothetical protein
MHGCLTYHQICKRNQNFKVQSLIGAGVPLFCFSTLRKHTKQLT